MTALSEMIGTVTAPAAGTPTNLAPLTARVEALENKPTFDPKSINDAIAELVANEKLDDAAAASLKAAFDALPVIDLAPYLKIVDLPNRLRVSPNKPDDTDWILWLQIEENLTELKRTIRLWARVEDDYAQSLIVPIESAIVIQTHATAKDGAAGSKQNTLPRKVKLTYQTGVDLQNNGYFYAEFPAGTVTRFRFEGLDAGGTSLEIGGGDVPAADTSFVLNPFFGNSLVTQAKWTVTYVDGAQVTYVVPVTR